jgi:phage/plasmid-associated DNA primase
MDQYRVECNPARSFLLENCEEDPSWQVPTEGLYEAYQAWCKANGYQPLGERAFGKEVKRVYPSVERVRRQSDGCPSYLYRGLRHPAFGYPGCRVPLKSEPRIVNYPPGRSPQPVQEAPPATCNGQEGDTAAQEVMGVA